MSWHKKNRSLTLIFFDIYNFNKHTFANTIGCSIKLICKITSHLLMWCMFIVSNLLQLNPRKPFCLMFLKLLSILTEWEREAEWVNFRLFCDHSHLLTITVILFPVTESHLWAHSTQAHVFVKPNAIYNVLKYYL